MLVVLTETYCNKVNIQITQWDDFIQIEEVTFCAEIYSLYMYNLIKKDRNISEYQLRYKLMQCSTGC